MIPTNTFLMLATQEAQIRALQNIYAHLAPNGKFLLNIRLASMRGLVDGSVARQGNWYTWRHPETGLPIRQRVNGAVDFNQQRTIDTCFIEYEAEREEFPMIGRWIFREEFQLLLRLTGFTRWEYFGTPDGGPLELGIEETPSYWIAHKL